MHGHYRASYHGLAAQNAAPPIDAEESDDAIKLAAEWPDIMAADVLYAIILPVAACFL